MKLSEAARQVCALIQKDIERFNLAPRLDPSSPDGDEAKFTLDGKIAWNADHLDRLKDIRNSKGVKIYASNL